MREAAFSVVKDLRENGVKPEELERVRGPLLNALKERLEKNRFWLFGVLGGSARHPEQLDRIRSLEKGYRDVTTEALNRLARKWLVPENASSITVLPVTREAA